MDPIVELAAGRGCTAAQLALAFVLARGEGIVAIPGTRRIDHLELNAAAADISLTTAELAALEAAFPAGVAAGTRYPAGGMKWLKL